MELYSAHEDGSGEKGPLPRPKAGATLNAQTPGAQGISLSLLPAGEQAGDSVAEMAQRDLDTALQLLANRAQYITGASGAAIALRRDGKNDMLCRASTGSNAPELGALLSTEVGLSGESVRTRQMLRCDDAELDARVNREVCRRLGIASVVVMPVVNDDEVLGVLELFSGKANAFGARDVSAVRRLSEMVETAVRLAQATADLPERLKMSEVFAPEVEVPERRAVPEDQVLAGEVLGDIVLEEALLVERVPVEKGAIMEVAVESGTVGEMLTARVPILSQETRRDGAATEDAAHARDGACAVSPIVEETRAASPLPPVETAAPKKKLYWSAALTSAGDAARPAEPDQSHVPPVLRSLRKCEACGFPISAGRVLCVECEEKKWRGHLKAPKVVGPRPGAIPSRFASGSEFSTESKRSDATVGALRPQDGLSANGAGTVVVPAAAAAKPEPRAFAAAAHSAGVSAPARSPQAPPAAVPAFGATSGAAVPASRGKEPKEVAPPIAATASGVAIHERVKPEVQAAKTEFVFSAGLEPSQSWLSANRYIIGVLLVIGVGVAAIFLLR